MLPSRRLSHDLATLWFQAPFVVAIRMQEMTTVMMSGGTGNIAEFHRMVTEKMAAAAESVMAVNLQIYRQWIAAMTATAHPARHAADAIAGSAIKPYSKRVRSNARRLSRKKA
jgi:hypothetical protein